MDVLRWGEFAEVKEPNPMLPTTLSLRGHAAWDKFTIYIIHSVNRAYNSDTGTNQIELEKGRGMQEHFLKNRLSGQILVDYTVILWRIGQKQRSPCYDVVRLFLHCDRGLTETGT